MYTVTQGLFPFYEGGRGAGRGHGGQQLNLLNHDYSLGSSQGHRQKSAHKWLLGGRKSVPKEGHLAEGETYNVNFKKKTPLLLTGYFRVLGFFFPFNLIAFSQILIS